MALSTIGGRSFGLVAASRRRNKQLSGRSLRWTTRRPTREVDLSESRIVDPDIVAFHRHRGECFSGIGRFQLCRRPRFPLSRRMSESCGPAHETWPRSEVEFFLDRFAHACLVRGHVTWDLASDNNAASPARIL